MGRTKIDYGIDLGTTNSSIAKMQNGNVKIIKSDKEKMDTTPSCDAFNKKRTYIGMSAFIKFRNATTKAFMDFSKGNAYREADAFIEFKRTMGTNASYKSSIIEKEYSSEELSAELLKKLKSYEINEEVNAVVITIPMMFRQLQKDATLRAAKLAGFQHCELLQEPIAASIAAGLSADNIKGYWLVFDFGGGTFDAALMTVNEGIMKVIGTDGDNHLGGKDIDVAIVDEILIPYIKENYAVDKVLSDTKGKQLLRASLKIHAEDIKKEIAQQEKINYVTDEPLGEDDNGDEIELDLRLTLDDVEKVIKPVFQKAINTTMELLKENNLNNNDINKIILVGGPTQMQTIRKMLDDFFTGKVDIACDPMTCVAEGAAIFASTKDIPEGLQTRDKTKIQLKVKFPATTVETTEPVGVMIERDKTEGIVLEKIFLEITRADNAWSSGKVDMADDSEVIEVQLSESKTNGFNITISDGSGSKLKCEPDNFTIIQGIKVAKAVLERYITLGVYHSEYKKSVVVPLVGLEENKTLPRSGKNKESLRTQSDIRPGNSDDILEIPLFASKGTKELYSRVELNEQIGEFIVSGDMVNEFIPKDTDVQIKLELDSSFKKKLIVFFEYTDQEIVLDEDEFKAEIPSYEEIEEQIEKAYASLDLQQSGDSSISESEIKELKNELSKQKEALNNDAEEGGRHQAHDNVKEIWHKIDKLERSGAWDKIEKDLKVASEGLENLIEKFGDDNDKDILNEILERVNIIIETQNIGLAKDIMQEMLSLEFSILKKDVGWWIYWIKEYDEHFENHDWSNKTAARNLITRAKDNIQSNPSLEILESIVRELWQLLPNKDQSIGSKNDRNLLRA
jgi:molecular chaperone DnaK